MNTTIKVSNGAASCDVMLTPIADGSRWYAPTGPMALDGIPRDSLPPQPGRIDGTCLTLARSLAGVIYWVTYQPSTHWQKVYQICEETGRDTLSGDIAALYERLINTPLPSFTVTP